MSFSIAAADLRKTYRTDAAEPIHALDRVTFAIGEGERVGIIGENGAGKSTLLRLLAGLSSPSAGSLDVRGRVHAALTLGVGLREEMTGRENMMLDAEIQGVEAAALARRVDAMADFADLGEFIDRPVRTYSSGMKSRLSFTSLVFVEPEILLIDEALSAGDQWFQRKAGTAIRELCARGKIVVIVSHGLPAIVEMCSRCLWLHRGRIAADGDPATVTALYSAEQRRREEERLASEFTGRVENWARSPAARIAELRLAEGPDAQTRHVLRPDDSATLVVDVELTDLLARPALQVRIERIDGLCVSENRAPPQLIERGLAPGRHRLRAVLPRILLGPGMFLLQAELRDDGDPVARRSLAFKVDTDRPLIGGRPVLYAPTRVAASRVAG